MMIKIIKREKNPKNKLIVLFLDRQFVILEKKYLF